MLNSEGSNDLYEKIRSSMSSYFYKYELGITVEIDEVLHMREEVKDFSISFDEDRQLYKILIQLDEFSRVNVNKVFTFLITFIAYEGATTYVRKRSENLVHYYVATLSEDGVGVQCEIDFTP